MIKEKILLIEDSKALSNILTKKMTGELDFEVIQAYTFEQAREIIDDDDDFFIALCDLNLPDAPNGEIVDFVISKKIPAIVLTASSDVELQKSFLKKNIIDYVHKGDLKDIDYIFSVIKRVSNNRDIKVLIVDDSIVARNELKRLFELYMFKVLVCAHGEEALNYLKDNRDIKLILTDYNMPVINGLEFTEKVREEYSKNEIIIFAMTASNEPRISSRFLKMGANDFIRKPYDREELFLRINSTIGQKDDFDKLVKMAKGLIKRDKKFLDEAKII
ncbi:MAG: response regulator [Sulfurospirillaceae bacterium]|nr:response regulator [Sulfurospirillaceae bacterium]